MFDSRNRTQRQGGYRQNENSREQRGVSMSADGASARPRFNPNATPQENGGRKRQRFTRTAGAVRIEANEGRPAFRTRTNPNSEQQAERAQRPRPTRNPGVYSNRKRQEYIRTYEDPTKPIRLNKYLANAGICSRREADDFIQAGVITVNGEVVDNLGAKVLPTDKVMFHNQPVRRERKVYILLNKPKNTVTTTDDPEERHTVLDIVRNACAERIYPVGRLDRNTTGVLLLTNDGDLAAKLTHPKFRKKKIYAVTLDRELEEADELVLRAGVELDNEKIVPDALEFPKEDRKHIGLEIHSGQNRVVRRMFEKVGYKVTKLDRVSFAGLTKKNVARGKYRFLTAKEVAMLQMGAFE
jgi:23S rRNA pseudouridine2605 synthase